MLSNSQILSIFPNYAAGGSPHTAQPPYPVTAIPWGQPQQGLLGNQWVGPASAPWPAAPVWGSAVQPIHAEGPQAGPTLGGDTLTVAMAPNGFPSHLNFTTNPPEPVQPPSPTSPQFLWICKELEIVLALLESWQKKPVWLLIRLTDLCPFVFPWLQRRFKPLWLGPG